MSWRLTPTVVSLGSMYEAKSYPHGMAWRCMRCAFTCDDDGPDYCPNDGTPLTRVCLEMRLNGGTEPETETRS